MRGMLLVKCKECGEHYYIMGTMINNKRRCPKCFVDSVATKGVE